MNNPDNMKHLIRQITLIGIISLISFVSFGQSNVVTTKWVKVANATTIFNENLLNGIGIINLADDKSYLTLKTIPSNKSISTCILNVDIKEFGTGTGGTSVDSIRFAGTSIKTLSLYQGGDTIPITAQFHDLSGEIVNCYAGTESITSTYTIVTFPQPMNYANYPLSLRAWYNKTISGKSVQIAHAIYDFSKTVNGFSFKVDTIAGSYSYLAVDTLNLYPIAFTNYIALSDTVRNGGYATNYKLKSYKLKSDSVNADGYTRRDRLASQIATRVAKNVSITPATNTKITYDAKGLVTGSTTATTADIPSSIDKRYVTDAQLAQIHPQGTDIQALTLSSGSVLGLTQTTTTVDLSYLLNKYNGCISIPTYTDNGNGTITLGTTVCNLPANTDGSGKITTYSLSGGTFTLSDLTQNYIVADYNSGTPIVHVITDVSLINETTVVPIFSIFRNGNVLHIQNWDALGLALANKVHQSIVKTQRYRRESGLSLSESGTRNLNLTAGRVWVGAVPMDLSAIASATDNLYFWYHSGGVWTSSVITQYPNTQYDNGTNLATLSNSNRYAVCWLFRGVEANKHLYLILGTGDYNESEARSATLPQQPIAISSHAVLVAKLIVQNGQNTATLIQSAFDTQFGGGGVSAHNSLTFTGWSTDGHTGTANTIAIFDSGGTASTTANNSTNWNTAYSKRLTSLGFTSSLFTATLADASTVTVTVPTFNQNTTGQAGQVANSQTIKFDTGSTEGTDLYTFNGSTAKTIDIKAGTNVTLTKAAGSITISASGSGGGTSTATIWTALTGTYASATTFTFAGTDTDAKMVELSLLTCTNSTGATRRIGYIKTATNNSGTISCTVVTDSDLASGDKDFKVAYNQKVTNFLYSISTTGECIADASYSQGMVYQDFQVASYLLPVDASVITPAAGTGAALTWNIYKGSTNLFSSAPDMSTNSVLRSQRPTTNTISAADNVSMRILSSAGATNKAADFQVKLYIVPQNLYTAFGMNWIAMIILILVSLSGSGQIKGCWRFEGNSNDYSGNGNNGTDTNITYSQANGKLNKGAGFVDNSKIQFSTKIMPIGAKTINCWVKLTATSWYYTIYDDSEAGSSAKYGTLIYIIPNGFVEFYGSKATSAARYDVTATTSIADGKWHMVTCSWDGTTSANGVKMYLDGVLHKTGTANATESIAASDNSRIGRTTNDAWQSSMNGSIDEPIIDKSVWSAAKVKNKYMEGLAKIKNIK